jgi:ribosomal protein L16 Arg81 hydroxylase
VLGPPWSFESLIAPISLEQFCSEYWGKKPLHVERGRPRFYESLVCLEDIERYLSSDDLLSRQTVRLRRRDYGPFEYPPNLSAVYGGLVQGKSLQFRNMERFLDPSAPLLSLLREMEVALEHPKESLSCYVTPANGESLVPHHDESEIFTLQIEGSKRWRFYRQIETDKPGAYAPDSVGAASQELVLQAGDLLYHPRGLIHEVTSENMPSFSITIVFLPILWRSMLDAFVARLASRPDFIRQMPAGTLRSGKNREALRGEFEARLSLIETELASFSLDAMLDEIRTKPVARMPPAPQSHVRHLFRIGQIELDSELERRKDLTFALTASGPEQIKLSVAGFDPLPLPAAAEVALRFVLDTDRSFRPSELDGLNPEDQIVLARILIQHGLVRFVG